MAILDPVTRRSSTRHARLAILVSLLLISIPVAAVQFTPPIALGHQAAVPTDQHASAIPISSRKPIAGRSAQANNFQWTGTLAQGQTIEVRGIVGSIRTMPSDNGSIQIEAHISDLARARIDVVPREAGVTICPVISTSQGAQSECQPAPRATGVLDHQPRIDFVVHVPVGVRFAGSMIHGDIEIDGLRSDANVATIDGNIVLRLAAGDGVDLSANLISGTIESDFPVYDSAPPFPSGGRPDAPRIVHTTIGNGGPAVVMTTVSGNIRLRQQ